MQKNIFLTLIVIVILPSFLKADIKNVENYPNTIKGYWVLNQLQILDQNNKTIKIRRDYNPYFKSTIVHFNKKESFLLTSLPLATGNNSKIPGRIIKDSFYFALKNSSLELRFSKPKKNFPTKYTIELLNYNSLTLSHPSIGNKKVFLTFKKLIPFSLENSSWFLSCILYYKDSQLVDEQNIQDHSIVWEFKDKKKGILKNEKKTFSSFPFIWESDIMYFKVSLFLNEKTTMNQIYKILLFDGKNFHLSSMSQNNVLKVFHFIKK